MLASLPQDILDKIGEHVADGLVREYALTTCCRTDPRLPLRPFDSEDDLCVSGIAADGVVLVRGASGGFLGEPHVSTNEGYFPTLDNGEWYSHLHFDADGLDVDYERTPGAPGLARHRFFRDTRDGAAATVRLHHSDDEARLLEARHRRLDCRDGTANGHNAALEAREALVEHDVDFRYLRIPGARACALGGWLRIATLSKVLTLRAKLAFVGALPLLARLEVPNPNDARAFPPKVRKQLAFTLDKVLVLAPREWLRDCARRAGARDDARDEEGYCANASLADIVH